MEIQYNSKEELIQIIEGIVRKVLPVANKDTSPKETLSQTDDSLCCLESGRRCIGCGGCGNVCKTKKPFSKNETTPINKIPTTQSSLSLNRRDLAKYIDHSLLKPDATESAIIQLCKEAIEYNFATVCINPSFIPTALSILKKSPVKICTVVGFPLGALSTDSKVFETKDAIAKGADEIDMVINIGRLKMGDYKYVFKEIQSVVKAAENRTVKVILEMASLTEEEKIAGCIIAMEAGAHFVKTSTGFGAGGATVADVMLMKKTVGNRAGIKAAGGIKTLEDAEKMIAAGAIRIGTSSGVNIVEELES